MDERLKQWLVLGREHYQKREFSEAEPLLRKVLEQREGYADVHNMLGVIAHERGQFAEAEAFFLRATELNPKYTEALLNLAVTFNDQGKYEDGRRVYDQVRKLRAEDADHMDPFVRGKIANMHAEVAQAYEDAGMPENAVVELERAVELSPKFADLQTRLGNLYRKIGDLRKASEHYAIAIDSNPKYTIARLMYGLTLLGLQNPEEAREQWRIVLEQEPGNKRASMYLRMVDNLDASESAAVSEDQTKPESDSSE